MKNEISMHDCIKSAAIEGQQIVDQCVDAFLRDRFAYSGEFIDFMTNFSTAGYYKKYWDIPLGSAPRALIEAVKIHRTVLRAHEHQTAQQS